MGLGTLPFIGISKNGYLPIKVDGYLRSIWDTRNVLYNRKSLDPGEVCSSADLYYPLDTTKALELQNPTLPQEPQPRWFYNPILYIIIDGSWHTLVHIPPLLDYCLHLTLSMLSLRKDALFDQLSS
uniref:Uncharacterized protein n=1 Tax=Nelumbo nucifera TaxID=4432 RepID=A0A822XRX6_NELNU|nr:TPA_asm: hypothetical protein HUJ06_024225 [Nelumbo nucifera]